MQSKEQMRKRALQYYYDHREAVLVRYAAWRRAHGIPVRKPKMTREERLAVKRICRRCGNSVTTPSLLLSCQNICIRCRPKTPEPQINKNRRLVKMRKRRITLLREIKLKSGCTECGYDRVAKNLDFHHRDPATKLFRLADAGRWNLSQVLAEVEKCDVVCRWCHAKKHT